MCNIVLENNVIVDVMTIFPKQCFSQNATLMLQFVGCLFKNKQQIKTVQALTFSTVLFPYMNYTFLGSQGMK